MNYIDLVILVVVALSLYLGYLRGFIRSFADFLALVLAIALAVFTYGSVGAWLAKFVPLPQGFITILGFFLVWFVVLLIYYGLVTFFYDRIPERFRDSRYNRWFGPLPALARTMIFIGLTLSLLSILPITGFLKQDLNNSFFARTFAKNSEHVTGFVSRVFGPAVADTVNFLTVKPQSNEFIQLGFKSADLTEDQAAEKQLLDLVNKERTDRGLKTLVLDENLSAIGAAHCRDMFTQGYFSHNTPDGKTPFDRMNAAGVTYMIAGENLALAPNVTEAFNGLMNSPSHKANMLSPDYGRIGIAVITDGVHGEIFAQEFTN